MRTDRGKNRKVTSTVSRFTRHVDRHDNLDPMETAPVHDLVDSSVEFASFVASRHNAPQSGCASPVNIPMSVGAGTRPVVESTFVWKRVK